MKKIIRGILAAVLSVSMISMTAFAQPEQGTTDIAATQSEGNSEQNNLVEKPEPSESKITLPNDMRAVFAVPKTDFDTQNPDFEKLYSDVKSLGMNAVVINSTNGNDNYYSLDLNDDNNILNQAIDAARKENLGVYVTLDVGSLIKEVTVQGGGLKSGFSAAAHKFAMKYNCDGIIITNYYTSDTPEMYEEYLRSGSGIGYSNWLYETNQFILRTLSEVIRKTSNTTAVGLLVENMWANLDSNPEGSDTNDDVQALYDGHCDTKKYLESNYADFIMVKAYGSTSDSELNFENVVSWWNDIAGKNGVKTYICHLNDRIGEYSDWNEDQLLQQLVVMKKLGGSIGGSAFNSLSSLNDDPLQSTDTLKKYFKEQINTESLFEELQMTSPSELDFVTYDPTVRFMGTFDENFDVYFDGEKIELNEAGKFLIKKDIDIGMNYFTIEHKGKKYDYSIERRVDVLKSVYDSGDITVEGGTRLSFTAVAYSGSDVYATIGGDTIALTEKGTSELVDSNGSYSEFVGYYTVASGLVGQSQYLGDVSYYATYSGYDESMWGGSVTISAKPEPPKKPINVELDPSDEHNSDESNTSDENDTLDDNSSSGSNEIVGKIDPVYTEEDSVTYVKVLNDYTDVLDPLTTGHIPSPEFSQMPAGTLDYYKSSVDSYIITTSGKRYDRDYVTLFDDTGLGYNALNVKSIGDRNGMSYIKLSLDYKTSFNVNTSISYVEGYEGPFGVTDFNAKYVYVTFDNITSITKLPDFDSCTLFSAGEWSVVDVDGIPKFRLTLTLRQAGIYSGMDAYYNDDGDLMLTFKIPTATLSGKTIVVSPGHGVDGDHFDPGAIGQVTEQEINLAVAKKLTEQLENMGATVVRLETESVDIYDRDRPRVARQYGADMYLELHCNSASNSSVSGCEVYYFTPWSQPLAKSINDNLASFYNGVYADGSDSGRGDRYSYYWYTLEQGFPSVLVEMGFVSNDTECLLMANPTNQNGMAKAIANGVYEYFARSGL